MELQLFAQDGTLCLRVHDGEPLWHVLTGALDDEPGQDVELGPGQLVVLVEKIREVLRDRLAAILPTGSPEYDTTHVVILGEPVALRVRNPRHYEVKRINSLYECLAGLAESGRGALLLAVPELSSVDHGIAAALDESGTGLDLAGLTAQVVDWFKKLAEATADADVRDGLLRTAGAIDEGAVAERADRLAHWNLLERRPDGGILASAKLRRIVR